MYYKKTNVIQHLDWITVAIYLALVIMGWLSIYAATYNFDDKSIFDLSGRAGMQMIWMLTAFLIGFFVLIIDRNWYEVFAEWIYVFVLFLLFITIFLAPNIKGSHSWLVIIPGKFQIQPAEFAKFATALIVAKCMGTYLFNILNFKNFVTVVTLICLPMGLILLQQETGSALVFLAFFLVLYREGMPGVLLFSGLAVILYFVLGIRYSIVDWGITPAGEFLVLSFILIFTLTFLHSYAKGKRIFKYITIAFFSFVGLSIIAYFILHSLNYQIDWRLPLLGFIASLCIYCVILAIKYRTWNYIWVILFALCSIGFMLSVNHVFEKVLAPHQKTRIEVTLGMIDDPSGVGYNVNQSKIAVGSGRLLGKGFLNGTQTKLKYVPEQDTDFIFCTIGEEHGFLGVASIIILFTVLILRLMYLAERQRSAFYRIYGYIVAAILFFHLTVNIGMVIGIMPVIGIPLPFFSYGGSSLWGFTILLFVFLRFDSAREK